MHRLLLLLLLLLLQPIHWHTAHSCSLVTWYNYLVTGYSAAAESLQITWLEVLNLELEYRRRRSPTEVLLTNYSHSNATSRCSYHICWKLDSVLLQKSCEDLVCWLYSLLLLVWFAAYLITWFLLMILTAIVKPKQLDTHILTYLADLLGQLTMVWK